MNGTHILLRSIDYRNSHKNSGSNFWNLRTDFNPRVYGSFTGRLSEGYNFKIMFAWYLLNLCNLNEKKTSHRIFYSKGSPYHFFSLILFHFLTFGNWRGKIFNLKCSRVSGNRKQVIFLEESLQNIYIWVSYHWFRPKSYTIFNKSVLKTFFESMLYKDLKLIKITKLRFRKLSPTVDN